MKITNVRGGVSNRTIIDFGGEFPLIVVEGELKYHVGRLPEEIKTLPRLTRGVEAFAFCGEPRWFTTKKGREAILCPQGGSHILVLVYGTGDRTWNGWYDIRPAIPDSRVFSIATAASKGGGCWYELWIVSKEIQSSRQYVSAEEAEYIDELDL